MAAFARFVPGQHAVPVARGKGMQVWIKKSHISALAEVACSNLQILVPVNLSNPRSFFAVPSNFILPGIKQATTDVFFLLLLE